jgi:hypothetical protein
VSSTRILQQLGGSFGIAILAVVLQQQAAGHQTSAGLAAAFAHTYWWALSFTGLAVLPALLVPARRRRHQRNVAAQPVASST